DSQTDYVVSKLQSIHDKYEHVADLLARRVRTVKEYLKAAPEDRVALQVSLETPLEWMYNNLVPDSLALAYLSSERDVLAKQQKKSITADLIALTREATHDGFLVEAIETGQPSISDIFRSPKYPRNLIAYASPAEKEAGQRAGLVALLVAD